MANPPGPVGGTPGYPSSPAGGGPGGPPPWQPAAYPPPPGFPPGPPGFPPPGFPDPAAARRRQRTRLFIIFGAAALLFGGFVTYNVLNPGQHVTKAEYAHVGDCLSGTSAYEMEVRPCDDPKATYKVVRSFDGFVDKKSIQASCAGAPGVTTFFFKEQNHINKHGNLLCLAPIKR